jgi:hypothetical protein
MIKTKIYIHIGLPKTGSSAVQYFCFTNRELLKKEGVFYPQTALDGIAHHFLPASINGRNFKTDIPFARFIDDIFSEEDYAAGQIILLSSEAFHNIREGKEIARLKEGLQDYDVKIIVYLRRQDKWVQSAYKQSIKSHRSRSKDKIEQFCKAGHLKKTLNFSRFLFKWEKAFGFENIIVRVYEEEQMPEGLYQDFLQILNIRIDNSYYTPDSVINPSLLPFTLNLLRLFNYLPLGTRTHNVLVKMLLKISASLNGIRFLREQTLLTPETRRDLIKSYSDANKEIAERYLKREDGILFYEKMP